MTRAARCCGCSASRSRRTDPVAKKSLIAKAKRKPKFAVRAYTRCTRCGRPRAVYRRFGLCRSGSRARAHRGELPGIPKSSWYPKWAPDENLGARAARPPTELGATGAHRPRRRSRRGNRGEEGHQAMTMTDPIADMLTRLRNANAAYQESVTMPYSKINVHLAHILQQDGYIGGFEVRDAEVGKNLVISLKYGP